jgi:ABC-2 type transport system permease protein
VIALVHAELRKLTTTRLWIGLVLGGALMAVVGTVVILVIAGTEQGRQAGLQEIRTVGDVRSLVVSGAVVGTFALILGATMSTSEYRYGTAGVTYLAMPRRTRVLVSKLVAAAPVGFAIGLLGGALPLLVTSLWFAVKPGSMPFDSSLSVLVAEIGLQAAFAAVIGVCAGTAIRSQLVAILALLGWTLIVEPIVQGLLPSLLKWFPFAGAAGAFGSDGTTPLLARPQAAVLLVTYVLAAFWTAAWLERRRDV